MAHSVIYRWGDVVMSPPGVCIYNSSSKFDLLRYLNVLYDLRATFSNYMETLLCTNDWWNTMLKYVIPYDMKTNVPSCHEISMKWFLKVHPVANLKWIINMTLDGSRVGPRSITVHHLKIFYTPRLYCVILYLGILPLPISFPSKVPNWSLTTPPLWQEWRGQGHLGRGVGAKGGGV